jgi:hypothetical protein
VGLRWIRLPDPQWGLPADPKPPWTLTLITPSFHHKVNLLGMTRAVSFVAQCLLTVLSTPDKFRVNSEY